MYEISEVGGEDNAATIHHFNSLAPETFPPLELKHLVKGYWWLAYLNDDPVAFAGMVPFGLPGVGYFKRCLVLRRGHGLQYRLMLARLLKAKPIGWTTVVSECHESNSYSAANFLRAGFEEFEPEQKWAKDSIYFMKTL
jgi:hypothetical protein